jgi:hypothetical protein
MAELTLYLCVKLTDVAENKPIPEYSTLKVSVANNFLHSLFQQCTIHLNETQITPSTSLYAYRAYIETVLGYGGDYKDSQARSALYIRDDNVTVVEDPGFIARANVVSGGKEFDLIGKPCVDICAQTRYLIPGIDVRIAFYRSPDDFYIHSEDRNTIHYKCDILEAKLLVTKHVLLPQILSQHSKLWQSGFPALYPQRRVIMKSYSLALGTIQNINENLLNGVLPDRLIIGLVSSSSLNGELHSSPFDFQDYGLKEITVSANGEQYYTRTYKVDFEKERIAEVYYNLYNGLGLTGCNEGPDITLFQYRNGKTLFVFNIRHINDGFCLP